MRRRLSPSKPRSSHQSRYDQLSRDDRTRLSHDDAEKSLRKIRSEARILLSKISEPEDESRDRALRHSKTYQDLRPAGLAVPSSATSMTCKTSPEGHRLSAREKGKGRADVGITGHSEPQRPSKSHHHTATENDWERHRDRTSKPEGSRLTSGSNGRAKDAVHEQSDVRQSSHAHEQHPATSHQTTAETGGEHQCDWKTKYDDLLADVEAGRQGQGSGVAEAGDDHQCDWKEKYLELKPEVEVELGKQGRRDDIGLEGLTIVLHLRGRDDLVINTDLRELDAKE